MSEEMKNIITLKQRAEKMLKNDYSRKIGDEEIYTIICEWEKNFDLYKKEKEQNSLIKEKLKELNIPMETLIGEFNRLEDLEDDREQLKWRLKEEREKNKELENNELVQKYMEALHIVIKYTERKPKKEYYKSSNMKDYFIELPYKYITFENGKAKWQKCGYNCSYRNVNNDGGGNYCLSLCNKTRKNIEKFITDEILEDLKCEE